MALRTVIPFILLVLLISCVADDATSASPSSTTPTPSPEPASDEVRPDTSYDPPFKKKGKKLIPDGAPEPEDSKAKELQALCRKGTIDNCNDWIMWLEANVKNAGKDANPAFSMAMLGEAHYNRVPFS